MDSKETSPQPVPEEWQICPKCNGGGRAMNMDNLIPSVFDTCDVCNGGKIIERPTSSASEISTLKQTIVDYDKQVIELKKEIEALKEEKDLFAMSYSGWYSYAPDAQVYKAQKLPASQMLALYKSRPYLRTDAPEEN